MKKQTNTDFVEVNAFDSFVFQTEELFEIKSDIKWILRVIIKKILTIENAPGGGLWFDQ